MLILGVEFWTGHPAAPWGDLADDPQKFIEARCIPPVQLVDPSRMKKADMSLIYAFWFQRQKTSGKPLRFKKNLLATHTAKIRLDSRGASNKGKEKEYVEISDAETDNDAQRDKNAETEKETEEPGKEGPADGSPAAGRSKPEDYLESLCLDEVFGACVKHSAELKVGNLCLW